MVIRHPGLHDLIMDKPLEKLITGREKRAREYEQKPNWNGRADAVNPERTAKSERFDARLSNSVFKETQGLIPGDGECYRTGN